MLNKQAYINIKRGVKVLIETFEYYYAVNLNGKFQGFVKASNRVEARVKAKSINSCFTVSGCEIISKHLILEMM